MFLRDAALSFPFVYEAFQKLVGKFGLSRLKLYSRYLPYAPGTKVLDLGCGPGTSVKYFKPDDYLGIDIDESYIKYAQDHFPNNKFILGDFSDPCRLGLEKESYDLVFAMGLFHHLDDSLAQLFMKNSFDLLKPNGRLVCIDGCHDTNQSTLAQKITLTDRGKFIRCPEKIVEIAERSGFNVRYNIEPHVYLIPYTTIILTLTK